LKRSKLIFLVILIAAISLSFIAFYAGHFLFAKKSETKQKAAEQQKQSPVSYKRITTMIDGRKQDINILEVDVSSGEAVIKPVLSFDSVYGFETLSSMALRKKAHAAVNAGFFYEYGRPAGMVCVDGKLITHSTTMFPAFIVKDEKAYLSQVRTELWISSGNKKMRIDYINTPQNSEKAVVYTTEFGKTNRVKGKNKTIFIQNDKIIKIAESEGSSNIPENGMLITIMGKKLLEPGNIPFIEGEEVKFSYEPYLGKEAQAYECGSWLVKNNKVVIGDRDPWVGTLENRDPRTAIGIKPDGKVLLVTVDGRQPGFSLGMTGKELGDLMVSFGAKDAAMLDGGASTTMIVKGKIMNRPSYKGKERPLGGGLIVQLKDN
jgi:exopolysaccharide biosynthesis protein